MPPGLLGAIKKLTRGVNSPWNRLPMQDGAGMEKPALGGLDGNWWGRTNLTGQQSYQIRMHCSALQS